MLPRGFFPNMILNASHGCSIAIWQCKRGIQVLDVKFCQTKSDILSDYLMNTGFCRNIFWMLLENMTTRSASCSAIFCFLCFLPMYLIQLS